VSADLEARLTAAAVVLADFRSWTAGERVRGDWQDWALRLAAALESAITGLRRALEMAADGDWALGELDATGPRSDGGLSATAEDAQVIALALASAARCGEEHGPDGPSLALTARYRDLGARLGASR
jgi:hypothetical protein